MKFRKLYDAGRITEIERYNKVLDTWTHAREQITDMMEAMQAMTIAVVRLRQSRVLDGSLWCSRWYRTDSSVGRYAWFDGEADRARSSKRRSRRTSAKACRCSSTSARRTVLVKVWPIRLEDG
jgi:hypothetical protein